MKLGPWWCCVEFYLIVGCFFIINVFAIACFPKKKFEFWIYIWKAWSCFFGHKHRYDLSWCSLPWLIHSVFLTARLPCLNSVRKTMRIFILLNGNEFLFIEIDYTIFKSLAFNPEFRNSVHAPGNIVRLAYKVETNSIYRFYVFIYALFAKWKHKKYLNLSTIWMNVFIAYIHMHSVMMTISAFDCDEWQIEFSDLHSELDIVW